MVIIHLKKTTFQYYCYGIIGAMNALIDICSLNFLLILFPTTNSPLLLFFNTLAFIMAAINSYLLNSRLTFYDPQGNRNSVQIMLFITQAIACLLISNLVFISAIQAMKLFGLSDLFVYNSSKVFSMIVTSFSSFIFLKFFVFNNGDNKKIATSFKK